MGAISCGVVVVEPHNLVVVASAALFLLRQLSFGDFFGSWVTGGVAARFFALPSYFL